MKKLLVLALVLGLASAANAMELSIGGQTDGPGNVTTKELYICQEIIIDVYGDADVDYLGYIIINSAVIGPGSGAGGEWGDDLGPPWGNPEVPEEQCWEYYYQHDGYPIVYEGAGDVGTLALAARYEEDDWGFGYEIQANSATSVPGGLQFEFLYHCCGPESEYVTITLWEAPNYTTPADTIVIHQYIPEPMTVALLGLGGLFLLRRRK